LSLGNVDPMHLERYIRMSKKVTHVDRQTGGRTFEERFLIIRIVEKKG
jgi:hypothetical protein